MASRPAIWKAARIWSIRLGCLAPFLNAILANSNHSNCGATSVDVESRSATVSAPGSPKTRAPSADASTTLTGISVLSYHRAGFGRRAQPKGTHPGQEIGRAQGGGAARSLFDNGQ